MKELEVKSLETNLASNITTVTVDILSVNGDFKRVLETLKFPVIGKFITIDDALIEAINEVLAQNGIEL